ncbi:hypothetical protein ACFL09_01995, partial [Planctomycetota bacterium]
MMGARASEFCYRVTIELTHMAPKGASATPATAENNKLLRVDRAAHDWYRFVLSFPPHLVRDYLGRFGADTGSRVLD